MGVISGVHYLHTRSPVIVHGDLKPVRSSNSNLIKVDYSKGNILIDDQWNPRVCDFGISRMVGDAGVSGLTTTSAHTGTARYLSYELVSLEDVWIPTTASDIHALACIGLEVG
jgi:serine/threonine protein kinase